MFVAELHHPTFPRFHLSSLRLCLVTFDKIKCARAGRPQRAVHCSVRRPDHVCGGAAPPGLPPARPVQPADRDHGRLALPGERHAAGYGRHAHAPGGLPPRVDDVTAGCPHRKQCSRAELARKLLRRMASCARKLVFDAAREGFSASFE